MMDRELIVIKGVFLVRCLKTSQELSFLLLSTAMDYLIGLKYFPESSDKLFIEREEGSQHES
jgi:hypothetical protein